MTGLGGAKRASIIINAAAIAALVAVNAAARLIVRLADPSDSTEFYIGLWSLGAMALVAAVASFVWTRRHLIVRVVADALVVIGITSVLVGLLAPFVSGSSPFVDLPFGDAVRDTLVTLLTCLVVLGVGTIIGSLVAMALGLDPKSRAWKAQAQSVRATARKRQKSAGVKR